MAGRALRPGTRRLARVDSRVAGLRRAAAAARGDCAVSTAVVTRSLLPRRVDRQLRSLERSRASDRDPITGLRQTVDAIWKVVEQAASEPALGVSRHEGSALLARRELVQRGACILSAVISRGMESGAFRPRPGCESWAIRRLPFAMVAGACVHWVFGLATAPSLRASVAVKAALDVLLPAAIERAKPRLSRPLPWQWRYQPTND